MKLFDSGEQRKDRVLRAGAAQLGDRRLVAQCATDPRERLQMVGAGIGGREQEEDEIDGKPVDRGELDRRVEPREISEDAADTLELAVRDGDPAPEAGRAKALALVDARGDPFRRDAGEARGGGRKLLEQRFLVGDRHPRVYRGDGYKIG